MVNTLAQITPYINLPKWCLLPNSFFQTQFNYCLLIWLYQSCANNRKINWLNKRCLQITYNNKQLPFNEIQEKDNSISVHVQNLQNMKLVMNYQLPSSGPILGISSISIGVASKNVSLVIKKMYPFHLQNQQMCPFFFDKMLPFFSKIWPDHERHISNKQKPLHFKAQFSVF